MERDEAARIHRTLLRELRDAEARVGALRKLVEGYEELFPGLGAPVRTAPVVNGTRPRGQDAAARILREQGAWMTVQDVVDEMALRGWALDTDNPNGVMRTTLMRLHKRGKVEKGKVDGRTLAYRWPAEDSASAESEDGPAATGPSSDPAMSREVSDDAHGGDRDRHTSVVR